MGARVAGRVRGGGGARAVRVRGGCGSRAALASLARARRTLLLFTFEETTA